MKYRVVPCIGAKVYYKVQVKSFLFWRDYCKYIDYGVGSLCGKEVFPTIKCADNFAIRKLGQDARKVDFNLA